MSVAVGIDLGTTYSCVAYFENGKAKVLANSKGDRIIPSCVAFNNELVLVGEDAVHHKDKRNVVYGIKRIIGLDYNDAQEVAIRNKWPFLLKNLVDTAQIQVEYTGGTQVHRGGVHSFYAVEISALVLDRLKTIVHQKLKKENVSAVITVPTHFSAKRRAATEDAARAAGITVLRLLNESTAAAIAYGVLKGQSRRILVFDIGGGTLDITIVDIQNRNITVKGYAGIVSLGGDDFTRNLADYLEKEIKNVNNVEVLNANYKEEIRNKAEEIKKKLSFEKTDRVDLQIGDLSYKGHVTRTLLTKLNRSLYENAERCVDDALRNANTEVKEIDDVVLVGGSLYIPYFEEMLKTKFGASKIRCSQEHYDELVAMGAAILASRLSGVKGTGVENLNFTDVAPLPLGTDVKGDKTSVIIPRQTELPAHNTRSYEASNEHAEKMSINICQGYGDTFSENEFVGHFAIPLSSGGAKQVDVTYQLDESGLLKAFAMEKDGQNKNELEVDLAERSDEQTVNKQRDHLIQLKVAQDTFHNTVERVEDARHELQKFVKTARESIDYPDVEEMCDEIDEWMREIATHGEELNSVRSAEILTDRYIQKKEELMRLLEMPSARRR